MLQHRKKDYLIRLLEELMKKVFQVLDDGKELPLLDKKLLLDDCFKFFETNYQIRIGDNSDELINKIPDLELLEQYPRLLVTQYDISSEKNNKEALVTALAIIEYVQSADKDYSWDRTILREDILRRLDDTAFTE